MLTPRPKILMRACYLYRACWTLSRSYIREAPPPRESPARSQTQSSCPTVRGSMPKTQFSCRTVRSMNSPSPLKGSRNSKIRILHEFALQKCLTFRAFPDNRLCNTLKLKYSASPQGMKLDSMGDSFHLFSNESSKRKKQS